MGPLASRVKKDTLLGIISDPFGATETNVTSGYSGIVIGRTNLPLVNKGDALFHIARFKRVLEAANRVDEFNEEYTSDIISTPNPESPII